MSTRHEVARPSTLRRTLHLLVLVSMLAALGAVAPHAAEAKSKSGKAKTESTTHAKKSTEKVDINSATLSELEALPGIGTVMAQKIVAGRPYKSVPDLKRAGIPPNTIKGLEGKVKAGHPKTEPTATAHEKAAEAPRTSAAKPAERAPEAKAEQKSAPGKTFFGIPIGGSSKPEPKAESAPAAPEKEREQPIGAARASVPQHVAPAEEAPAKGMVWVNLDSKVYHYEGDHWYGTTKHGKYMWEDQAIREGYRAAKKGGRPSGE